MLNISFKEIKGREGLANYMIKQISIYTGQQKQAKLASIWRPWAEAPADEQLAFALPGVMAYKSQA